MIPTPEQTERRLAQILARGDVNLGGGAGRERLMLMLTRSCELRCGYCYVEKSETAPSMSIDTAKRAIDLVMSSLRPTLEIQLFGGEPTRRWDVLEKVLDHAYGHPRLAGRRLEVILTTNGIALDDERVKRLERWPVHVLFSLDGDSVVHRRFRNAHLLSDTDAYVAIDRAIDRLRASPVSWFMNAVLPPAAAGDVMARYEWARARGIPRLQLNYAVGMAWTPAQSTKFLTGLEDVLRAHHRDPGAMQLYNWRSDCEPVMLSDDLIVDVDGSVVHDGAIFLERAFGKLKDSYRRGHVDTLEAFDPLRWDLRTLYRVMTETYPEGSAERGIIAHNIRFGASVDLLIQSVARELGRTLSRGQAAASGKARA
jgi:hypothetical protein